jgi:hydrogenase maturation protease
LRHPSAVTRYPEVLIGAVGYSFQGDLSAGHTVMAGLREQSWPPNVSFEDLSVGPIAVVHNFQARTQPYDRVVLVAAHVHDDPPGTVRAYRWDGQLPDADEIQARIGEAVTGVVSLENLLVIGGHFQIWPDDVRVVEIEPGPATWGAEHSPVITNALDDLARYVREMALDGM